MNEEILKYANGFNANREVLDWLERNTENKPQGEIEHVIDYMVNNDKDYSNKSYDRMVKDAKKWMEKLNKKGEGIQEVDGEDIEVIKKWRDGFRFVKLISKDSYKREGFMMNHCVSSYYGKDDIIYSLRDKDNKPHATLSNNSMQIKGYGNGSIHPRYIKYNVEMLEKLGLKVRDNEMKNLGYINVEEFKKYLSKKTKDNLFNKKYHYLQNELLDKNNEEFACLELWDKIPLIDNSKKTLLNINFNLNSFNSNAFKFLWNSIKNKKYKEDSSQLASSGYSSKLASSGNSSQLASSGDSSQLASSGYSSQLASSGYSSKLASSGDYSKLASSGDYSKLASSGDYSKLASSGYSSKLASSGNSSQLASSGDSSQLASSGYSSKLASSGNSSQLASSGDSSQLASSGYSSQLASSGYSSKLASSGDYSKLASSGDYSKLASSGDYSKLASSGYSSKLASSGNSSQLASSGDSSQLASSGYSSQLASSGDYSKLASSGDYSKLECNGKNSVCTNIGINCKIKGIIGTWITLAEYDKDNNPIYVKSAKIDGIKLKENVWYKLKDKKFVECEDLE